MLFNYFNAREEKEFGQNLARVVLESFLTGSTGKTQKKKVEKSEALTNRLFGLVERFKAEHRLNFFKIAKLANAFKWALLEAECSPEFVDEMTKLLIIKLRQPG